MSVEPASAELGELMERLGRNAVAAAAVLAQAGTEAKNARSRRRRPRDPCRRHPHPRSQRARHLGGAGCCSDGCAAGSAGARCEAGRGDGPRHRGSHGAAGPDRHHCGRVAAAEWTRIQRVRVPLGVIGIIYESRPNVTADAGALCLKSGNAVILRGGSESRAFQRRHSCLPGGGTDRGRASRGLHPARADHRPGGGRLHAGGDDGLPRCHRAPRRQESGGACAAGGAGAGHRPSGGQLPCLRRSRCGPAHGARHRAQREDAADRHMRGGRDPAHRPRLRRHAPGAARAHAAGCRLRGARRCHRAAGRMRACARQPKRTGTRNIWMRSSPCA